MKQATLLLSFLLLITGAIAQTGNIQNIYARHLQNLSGDWHYIIDPYETGYYNYRRVPYDQAGNKEGGYYSNLVQQSPDQLIEYDFSHCPTLQVPGDWNSQKDELLFYEGTVWYERHFTTHPVAGKKYFLCLGAVNYEAHVYVNGKKAGMHVGGFTPFQFDVTSLLKDGDNNIVVKADNTRKKEAVPTDNTDWWNYGGITRDVLLAEVPDAYIRDYKIQLTKGNLKQIEGHITLAGSPGQSVTVSIPEASIEKKLTADANGEAWFTVPAKKITYWSPETPRLYPVTITTATDTVTDKIGFRTIETKGKDILLNGKSIFLRGIAIHEENPLIPGRVRSEGDARMLLNWAKELGCNFVRLAHYPHHERMARLADEMGILVWEEVPVYWTIAWQNPDTYQNAQAQLTTLVERDKNRASVIIWSIGNETPLSQPRYTFMSNLADHVHGLDSTRLVSAALEVHGTSNNKIIINDTLGRKLDIVSFNEYIGWYSGGLPSQLSRYDFEVAYDKPIVISELGAGAQAGFHADENTRFSEEYQEAFYREQMKIVSNIDGLRGMTPWVLVDFRSPKRVHPVFQQYWNRKGLISSEGIKKKAWWVLKDFYEQKKTEYSSQ